MPLILVFLLFPLLAFGQDLETLLNPSLRLLFEKVSVSEPTSCFDYPVQKPNILKTRSIDCSKPFKPLPVGKHILMQKTQNNSGNYIISRTAEKKYQAILNLKFIPNLQPYSGRAGDETLAETMLNRTRNCMSEMKPYLRGPDGEELEIIIATNKEQLPFGMYRPDENVVKVSYQGNDFRGNAAEFGSTFDCTTIGHEILHHLGLCDEYHEGVIETPGYPEMDWECRPVTARNSYMRNMTYAFQTTLPLTSRCECDSKCQMILRNDKAKNLFLSMNGDEIMATETSIASKNNSKNPAREICVFSEPKAVEEKDVPNKAFTFDSQEGNVYKFSSYRVFAAERIFYDRTTYTCECKGHQKFCHKLLGEMKKIAENVPPRSTCPFGTTAKSTGPSIGNDPKGTRVDCDKDGKCDLVISTRGNGKSLLSRNHFTKILAGSCKGGSPAYESCEIYAYMSKNDPLCAKMPPQCQDDDYYLGSDQ